MTHLFLTSSVHAVARDIATRVDLTKNNSLVFVNTPAEAEEGDKQWLLDDRQALVDVGFVVTDYTITGKSKDQLYEDLEHFDYIYMSGGNTWHLLQQSQKTGFTEVVRDCVLQKGKVYIGTSAGSIIAGEKCPDYLLEKNETNMTIDASGYGFVNFTIMPHWGSKIFKNLYLGGRMDVAYNSEIPFVLLNDQQYIEVKDGKLEIVVVKT